MAKITNEQWEMMYWIHLTGFRLRLSERIVHTALILLSRLFNSSKEVIKYPLAYTATLLYLTGKAINDAAPTWEEYGIPIAAENAYRLEMQIVQLLNWDLLPEICLDHLSPIYQISNAYYLLRLCTLLECIPKDQVRLIKPVLDGYSIDPRLAKLVSNDAFFRYYIRPTLITDLPRKTVRIHKPSPPVSTSIYNYGAWRIPGVKIGRGTYGSVYLYQNQAWKEFTLEPNLDPGIIREVAMLQRKIKGLLLINSLVNTTQHLYTVMPYGGCNLYTLLRNRAELPISRIMRQMALNLYQLHKAGYIHRDIKLENFVYNGKVSLIDPGLSVRADEYPKTLTIYTANYRPPEILLGYDYSFSADIWALGKCFMQLYLGVLFNESVKSVPLLLYMQACTDFGRPPVLNCSREVGEEINRLLNKQPENYQGVIWNYIRDPVMRNLFQGMVEFDPRYRLPLTTVLQLLE